MCNWTQIIIIQQCRQFERAKLKSKTNTKWTHQVNTHKLNWKGSKEGECCWNIKISSRAAHSKRKFTLKKLPNQQNIKQKRPLQEFHSVDLTVPCLVNAKHFVWFQASNRNEKYTLNCLHFVCIFFLFNLYYSLSFSMSALVPEILSKLHRMLCCPSLTVVGRFRISLINYNAIRERERKKSTSMV